MANKYNFTDGFNKGVSDSSPEWMNDLFNKEIKKSEPVIIKDLYNGNNNIKKCSMCGKPLTSFEIGKCSKCYKIK